MPSVTTNPIDEFPLSDLSPREIEAIVDAASWYGKYHQRMIDDGPDGLLRIPPNRLEHFRDLYSALWKLGTRMYIPERLKAL